MPGGAEASDAVVHDTTYGFAGINVGDAFGLPGMTLAGSSIQDNEITSGYNLLSYGFFVGNHVWDNSQVIADSGYVPVQHRVWRCRRSVSRPARLGAAPRTSRPHRGVAHVGVPGLCCFARLAPRAGSCSEPHWNCVIAPDDVDETAAYLDTNGFRPDWLTHFDPGKFRVGRMPSVFLTDENHKEEHSAISQASTCPGRKARQPKCAAIRASLCGFRVGLSRDPRITFHRARRAFLLPVHRDPEPPSHFSDRVSRSPPGRASLFANPRITLSVDRLNSPFCL